MADQDNVNNNENAKEEGEAVQNMPLTEASRSGFNDRAWNDPPPLLLNSAVVRDPKIDAARPKLTARLPYPVNDPSIVPHIAPLDASGPPPTSGFVKPKPQKSTETSPDTSPEKSVSLGTYTLTSVGTESSLGTSSGESLLTSSEGTCLDATIGTCTGASAGTSTDVSLGNSLEASPEASLNASPEGSPEKPTAPPS